MITKRDLREYKIWLQKTKHVGGCIYHYLKRPKVRAGKCLTVFRHLKKDDRKRCGYKCPCDQYGVKKVVAVVAELVDAGQVTEVEE